jgi:hypothetical protein
VGAGIAASGVLIAVTDSIGDWRVAWWSAAGLTGLLLALGWFIGEPAAGRTPAAAAQKAPDGRRHHRWFIALVASYFLEGAGYIVAGTFLVAAVSASGPGWLSSSVWTLVGVAAIPSCAAWTWLSARTSRPTLITGALVLQSVGIALLAGAGAAFLRVGFPHHGEPHRHRRGPGRFDVPPAPAPTKTV